MTESYATQTSIDMNDTMEFCARCMEVCEVYTYRPDNRVQNYRNEGLHHVMHHRAHQPVI